MQTSGTIGSIAKALATFQGEVQNPKNSADNPLYPKYEAGNIFGNWTILYKTSKRKVVCRCNCGTIKELYRTNLGSEKSISCGCSRKSGAENTKLYNIWSSMKDRCLNKNHKFYKDYGGRGILICNEWIINVSSFYNWAIANGYKEGLTIDRVDNDRGYEPDNCRWATRLEQANNKRNNLNITFNGVAKTVAEWSREYKLNNKTILSRIRAGWILERLFIPAEKRVKRNA